MKQWPGFLFLAAGWLTTLTPLATPPAEGCGPPRHRAASHLPAELPSVRLVFSCAVLDPRMAGDAMLKCIVKNDTARAIQVPVGYDGRAIVVQSGQMTLHSPATPKLNSQPAPGNAIHPERLEPGKELVVFELPLRTILRLRDSDESGWGWSWMRRPEPPRSPIHKYRQTGFRPQAPFTVSIESGGQKVRSQEVILKVRTEE